MEWFLKVVKEHYLDFSGRARRKEYWMYILIHILITLGFYAIAGIGFLIDSGILASIGYGLASLVGLALLIPSLAVVVRRLHDTGRSGWWFLISLVPLIGSIVMIVFLVQEGDPGPNQYGEDPKANERFI